MTRKLDLSAISFQRMLSAASYVFYVGIAVIFGLSGLCLLVIAVVNIVGAVIAGEGILENVLDAIGMATIAIAVFDVTKFLIEQELIHSPELRLAGEARRSLTRFFSIILIALSLEGIVLIFEKKADLVSDIIYPTAILAVVALLLIALGVFQRLAQATEERSGEEADDEELDRVPGNSRSGVERASGS